MFRLRYLTNWSTCRQPLTISSGFGLGGDFSSQFVLSNTLELGICSGSWARKKNHFSKPSTCHVNVYTMYMVHLDRFFIWIRFILTFFSVQSFNIRSNTIALAICSGSWARKKKSFFETKYIHAICMCVHIIVFFCGYGCPV